MISPPYQSQKEEEIFVPRTNPRISHLRKLYAMILLQWTLSAIIFILARSFSDFASFLLENSFIFLICIIIVGFIIIISFFFRSVVSVIPLNILVYIFFIIAMAFCFAYGAVSSFSNECFMILVGVWLISASLLIYVLTTKCEITYQGATLFILAAIFLGLEGFLLYSSMSLLSIMIISIAEIIWGFYIIYDTQTIVSGVKYDWNTDDCVSGAIGIYMDVIVLILRLCELIKNLIVKERN